MVNSSYVPDSGDIVWLNFTPQSGHEQMGKQPALTVSPKEYNQKVRLALFCPITTSVKGYPFEVVVSSPQIKGVVLSDQIKSLDWETRQATFITKIHPEGLEEVLEKIKLLL